MGGILVLLLAGGAGEKGTPCGKMSPLWAAEGDTLRQGVPTLPPAAPAGGSGGPLAKPLPAAALPPAPTYEYNATGKPDPFKPFIETDLALKKKMEEDLIKKTAAKGRPISPLQQMEIEQLHLAGIAGGDQGRTAIVEDGVSKKHYPLFVGTYIGMNGGRIVSIRPDRVIIEERLPGQSKKVKKAKVKRITVMLHKEDEGKP
jgi:type IV pilus assembly protein PilP